MLWISLSLLSALFYSVRYIIIKKYLTGVDTFVTTFATRFFGAIFLAPFIFFAPLKGIDNPLFWKIILITSILTGIATLLQFHSLKNYEISACIPFMAFIPLFMVICVYLIFGEVPNKYAFLGVITLCFGAYLINFQKSVKFYEPFFKIFQNRGSLYFFISSIILGLTTTLDRLAIDNAGSGGLCYSIFWHIVSSLLFSVIFLNKEKYSYYKKQFVSNIKTYSIQGLFAILSFVSQMMAVEYAKNVASNVIYVKALNMVHMLIGVLIGIMIFNESKGTQRVIGTIFMLTGALTIVFFFK